MWWIELEWCDNKQEQHHNLQEATSKKQEKTTKIWEGRGKKNVTMQITKQQCNKLTKDKTQKTEK
jgi:hypothetical protein